MSWCRKYTRKTRYGAARLRHPGRGRTVESISPHAVGFLPPHHQVQASGRVQHNQSTLASPPRLLAAYTIGRSSDGAVSSTPGFEAMAFSVCGPRFVQTETSRHLLSSAVGWLVAVGQRPQHRDIDQGRKCSFPWRRSMCNTYVDLYHT